ncbi:FadR/GntR family transcriptional regulator [Compostimonas suwonensis]|uniref:DNA-binding FadR family transcriptional regulator n=1 Tax=Compostimonas suwonensis TaxID=1048394 RepID=A0A2M9C3Q9_9MICO|nr:FCD domain-containing protein [Compostimonas suwonensis]PJJ65158.1 DNA-binding FadR family transcriptional regulator [Compostimonas suwonensis]
MADSPRAWETVLAHIESALIDGSLRPGDHLPPERTLAAELGVGRSSVREALRVLEVLGLIRTQTGSGPHAGAIIVATPSGGMSALMRLQVAANGFAVQDVVATRLLLESAIAADLATRGGDLAGSRQLLDAMQSDTLTEAEFLALDAQFHVSLAEASGNEVVAAMMAGLRNSIESYVLAAAERLADWATTSARLRQEHTHILAAIEARDAASARRLLHDHIAGYYAETQVPRIPPAPLADSRLAGRTPH